PLRVVRRDTGGGYRVGSSFRVCSPPPAPEGIAHEQRPANHKPRPLFHLIVKIDPVLYCVNSLLDAMFQDSQLLRYCRTGVRDILTTFFNLSSAVVGFVSHYALSLILLTGRRGTASSSSAFVLATMSSTPPTTTSMLPTI